MPALSPSGFPTTAITPNSLAGSAADFKATAPGVRLPPGVPPGAQPVRPNTSSLDRVVVVGKFGNQNILKHTTEQRVRIKVPPKYLVKYTKGSGAEELSEDSGFGGIVFPYTPTISYGVKADWSEIRPLHSNFNIPFYQRSSVGEISISGQFTVENGKDAEIYLSTVHLLRALTKMRFGGASNGDADSGAPPPICRLFAFGPNMLSNVPIAITGVRIELPNDCDYFSLRGTNSVPTVSTLAITCIPVYSRKEMQNFSVTKYLNRDYSEGYI
jgi:hypothetical protein